MTGSLPRQRSAAGAGAAGAMTVVGTETVYLGWFGWDGTGLGARVASWVRSGGMTGAHFPNLEPHGSKPRGSSRSTSDVGDVWFML